MTGIVRDERIRLARLVTALDAGAFVLGHVGLDRVEVVQAVREAVRVEQPVDPEGVCAFGSGMHATLVRVPVVDRGVPELPDRQREVLVGEVVVSAVCEELARLSPSQ